VANRFGISREDERGLRARDVACVYCGKAMRRSTKNDPDQATIEHLNLNGPFYVRDGLRTEDVAICCRDCNTNRLRNRLLDWFESPYCARRNINRDTVAQPVKKYLRELPTELEKFVSDSKWTFAKTMPQWPHEYVVQEQVDGELFAALARLIDARGYEGRFYEKKQVYFDHGEHTYWQMGNIINRCPTSETYERREKEGRLPRGERT